jgi:hypothetical protein
MYFVKQSDHWLPVDSGSVRYTATYSRIVTSSFSLTPLVRCQIPLPHSLVPPTSCIFLVRLRREAWLWSDEHLYAIAHPHRFAKALPYEVLAGMVPFPLVSIAYDCLLKGGSDETFEIQLLAAPCGEVV